MSKESFRHFKNDVAGKVDLPGHKRAEIDAVVSGKAKLLGKGDDGIAFQVGDLVVKVSTTVPFHPDNQGHRTPTEAQTMLQRQVEVGNMLADKGIKGIQRSEYVEHGDKGFQIKPWVEIPEKWTRAELDEIQTIVRKVHEAGYSINDEIQAGKDPKTGAIVMFDVGKAAAITSHDRIYGDIAGDNDRLKMLYRASGEKYVQLGRSEGDELFAKVEEKWNEWMGKNVPAGFMRLHLSRAQKMRRAEAEAKFSGDPDELKRQLDSIEGDAAFMEMELEDIEAAQAAKKEAKKAMAFGDLKKAAYKLHYRTKFQGFDISIENRAGSVRRWYDKATDTEGETKMVYPYGYIRMTEGVDGDHVDVFIGPDESAARVFVVHQMRAPDFKAYDEDKCMLGFRTAKAAKAAYLQHFDKPGFFGSMTAMPLEEFRRKVYARKRQMIKAARQSRATGQLDLFAKAPRLDDPTLWRKALDEVGIPPDRFHLVVKYARLGHEDSRDALDRVQELVKGFGTQTYNSGTYAEEPAAVPDRKGSIREMYVPSSHQVRTMGNYGDPARRAGSNVERGKLSRTHKTAEARDDWPPQRRKRKIRRKRNLEHPAQKYDVVGLRQGGDWEREYDPKKVTITTRIKTPQDHITARESLEQQQRRRVALREDPKINDVEINR